MNKVLMALALAGSLLMGGCASVAPYAEQAREVAEDYNDAKYDTAKTGACSVPIRVLLENYATDPDGVRGLIEWCGYGTLLRAYSINSDN